MLWYEYLVIGLAVAFVAGVVILQIIRKKQGKGGCDCGCSHCTGNCPACKPKREQEKK